MIPPKIVIHTDVFLEYLLTPSDDVSGLRMAMRTFFCYTTVFNAIQLFSLARTERESSAVEHAMSAMKILGLNSKNAKKIGGLLKRNAHLSTLNILIAGICVESKLPLLTSRPKDFRGMTELTVIHPATLSNETIKAKLGRNSLSHA